MSNYSINIFLPTVLINWDAFSERSSLLGKLQLIDTICSNAYKKALTTHRLKNNAVALSSITLHLAAHPSILPGNFIQGIHFWWPWVSGLTINELCLFLLPVFGPDARRYSVPKRAMLTPLCGLPTVVVAISIHVPTKRAAIGWLQGGVEGWKITIFNYWRCNSRSVQSAKEEKVCVCKACLKSARCLFNWLLEQRGRWAAWTMALRGCFQCSL